MYSYLLFHEENSYGSPVSQLLLIL